MAIDRTETPPLSPKSADDPPSDEDSSDEESQSLRRHLPADRWIREEHEAEFPDANDVVQWDGPNVKSFGVFISGSSKKIRGWNIVIFNLDALDARLILGLGPPADGGNGQRTVIGYHKGGIYLRPAEITRRTVPDDDGTAD
jgi:hypothetical protein